MKDIDMQTVQEHLQNANTLETDFLAEVILSALIERGVDYGDIQIVRRGEQRAGIGKDIDGAELLYKPDKEASDYLKVYVNRRGLFDILPEGLFFDGRQLPVEDIETMVQRVRESRIQEKKIRKFFSLYENEIDQTKVETQLLERRVDNKNIYPDFASIFAAYWPLVKLLSLQQAAMFIKILPILHRIRGNERNICKAMTLILGLPVRIDSVINTQTNRRTGKLGAMRIGENFVLGSNYRDGLYDSVMIIEEIPQERIPEFLEGGKGWKIVSELTDMLFPADMKVKIKLKGIRRKIHLSDKKHPEKRSFLGINSCLG